ncbi:Aspartyl/glutamyl-tRNA(Asn/Gln) amidotransferase subunit B [Metamycoplasma cloacale]|uniref:Aspartyl/glutamyl-tRNA(Asn/Gln) amidotransferase subunit B n=1 Tax=Metamycoplasma cloacale TaxID=92401 RepID=A0A2Z4LLQ3_9BACT|nr:Asp-tRNA(Asn)/Glu-tRNA(Gln) amidotransferase subunit GatB [Metamycoplasma cloacale]AWX42646.1 Asp-tRNA(Asn)/Glu-tRNA(Gln) amidotransferase subunit GatB [Metamycoplasma cloacale]VEU79568.1 Aspartyl/glutamyl-tRNA(Asn/Gln) amidotransferase subunit B [Metamycoplasma cloacale]
MINDWELVIGIEIHLELNTKTKMFSPAPNTYEAKENCNVSHIDLGYPGTLPLVNSEAIIKGIKLAKALNMTIDSEIRFDRKNYFYPDLNKGYQITQQFRPIGKDGLIKIKVKDQWKDILIERIHLEEDTAKSIHDDDYTYLNQNRASVPLIEIVSRPVIHSIEDAKAYVEAIRLTALALNISDAKMNEGSLRTDVNISVRKKGTNDLNTRVEIKNLNSISNIEKAIQYEMQYQINCYENNQTFEQCTKRFDEQSQTTIVMRSKSDSIDYKYFPDPNIPYISLSKQLIDAVNIEELPFARENRYLSLGLNNVQISQLINNIEYAKYLDSIESTDFKKSANIFFSEVVSYLNSNNLNIQDLLFTPRDCKDAIELLNNAKIDKKNFIKLIELKQNNSAHSIIDLAKNNQLYIESIVINIADIVADILKENSNLESQLKTDYNKALKFIMGQFMKKTMGKGNTAELNKYLEEKYL